MLDGWLSRQIDQLFFISIWDRKPRSQNILQNKILFLLSILQGAKTFFPVHQPKHSHLWKQPKVKYISLLITQISRTASVISPLTQTTERVCKHSLGIMLEKGNQPPILLQVARKPSGTERSLTCDSGSRCELRRKHAPRWEILSAPAKRCCFTGKLNKQLVWRDSAAPSFGYACCSSWALRR